MNIIQIGCHMGDDHVLIKFKNNTRVSIIKEFLDKACSLFEDNSFDFI
jgi:hypothetical protein